MSKISTYDVAPLPKLSDKLIGTSVGGVIKDRTYNFTLQELLDLFIPYMPSNGLQGVLDYNNTATQDIILYGTVYSTNLEITNIATLLDTYLTGETHISGGVYDRVDSIGLAGQVLASTGTQVEWVTLGPSSVPDLQQVLTSGNTADVDIVLDANIEALTVSADEVIAGTQLTVQGALVDSNSSTGTLGQVLISNTETVEWTNLPVYTATSPLSINSITKVISIQQANSIQNGYLSSTDWIDFHGKQNAINLTTTGNSGVSTFISNTLNVPNYTLSGLGGVPQTRTLTINGVTYDLSANRSWTISAGVASVTASSPLFSSGGSTPNITIQQAGSSQNGYLSIADWTIFNTKQNALSGTGIVKSTSGTITYITDNSSNWNTAYNDSIVSAAVTGTSTKTLTLNQQDGGTVTASWTDGGSGSGLTSVGLSMPVAFSVANTPLTSNGTIAVTGAGTATQYIRGDGQLATFPSSGGGGSSVFYYLNGSIAASVATYKQMSNTAVIGAGTNFNLVGNGLIAQFLTDVGNPNRLEIPGGAWNFEMFFSMSSSGGTPQFYVELLKYDGAVFTSIANGSAVPETISGGTPTDLYLSSLAVPTTTLLLTDRLAVRVYIVNNSGGRTATLHTEDNNLCQIITTFSAGISALNGLTSNNQYLAAGTAGTDFAINSLLETHTFNLPTASAINRGALSSADWTTFNNKADALSGTTNTVPKFTSGTTIGDSNVKDDGNVVTINATAGSFGALQVGNYNGNILMNTNSSSAALIFQNTASSNKLWDLSTPGNDFAIDEANIPGAPPRMYFVAGGHILVNATLDDPTGGQFQVTGAIQQSAVTSSILKASSVGVISAASAGVDYQDPITLTTTGTSGAATFIANTLNIPDYSGGGGSSIMVADSGTCSTIRSGVSNIASGIYSSALSGQFNCAIDGYATIGGGYCNGATAYYSTIGGGITNYAGGSGSTIGGGQNNLANCLRTTISGGYNNIATSNNYASILGGRNNTASGTYSSITGGSYNTASWVGSFVGSGCNNNSSGLYSTVTSGYYNTASGYYSSILGGKNNYAIGYASVISGGGQNTNSGCYSSIAGGNYNTISGNYSSIVGNHNNDCSYTNSYIIGSNICASQNCTTFVNDLSVCSFNLCSGCSVCIGANGVLTATAGGGGGSIMVVDFGLCSTMRCGNFNSVMGSYGTVSGGCFNNVNQPFATISGGQCNNANGGHSTISGGYFNATNFPYSTVGGGAKNNACNGCSTVSGGYFNTASGLASFVGGGGGFMIGNTASANYSVVVGGVQNIASDCYSFVGGGHCNTASGGNSFIGGGWSICASGINSVVVGGFQNSASASDSSILGGRNNSATALFSTVSGGCVNTASGIYSSVSGGTYNTSFGQYSHIGGGSNNTSNGDCSTLSGGYLNCSSGVYSFVGGGKQNTSSGIYSSISGGCGNTASNYFITISGGRGNIANASYSTIGGGYNNTACGCCVTISGGVSNLVQGCSGFVGGGICNNVCSSVSPTCAYGGVVSGGVGNNTFGGFFDVATNSFTVAPTICNAGNFSFIGGGLMNIASGNTSSLSGGYCNNTSGYASFIGGGTFNTASGNYSTISGGYHNTASASKSTVSGGYRNIASAFAATASGYYAIASGQHSVVAGGYRGTASNCSSTISGGYINTASGAYSVVGGGKCNISASFCSTISGGYGNTICNFSQVGGNSIGDVIGGGGFNTTGSDYNSCYNTISGGCGNFLGSGDYRGYNTISGGRGNQVSGTEICYVTIGGGFGNTISQYASYSVIGGGGVNTISAYSCFSFIGGGSTNTISTYSGFAGILGGQNNTLSIANDHSFIVGSGLTSSASYTTYTNALSKSSGTFRINHPDPSKTATKYLQHSFVESPTRGDNIYRYVVCAVGCAASLELPSYYKFLNENDQVWVTPKNHFGAGYGVVDATQSCVTFTTNADGEYNVLIIGTRKDIDAMNGFTGVEQYK